MLLTPNNASDIAKYYKGSYVKFHDFGDKLFNIAYVNTEKISGITEDNDEFELDLHEEAPYHLDYILPKKSYFQYKKWAVMLFRVPARQYRRGCCSDNTRMRYWDSGSVRNLDVTFDSMRAYVNKPSFQSLTSARKSKNYSVPLSPRIALHVSSGTLLLDNQVIAYVSGKTITMERGIFTNEVVELLKRHNELDEYTCQA